MSYQVLARKWRPQRFDAVVGQQAVTTTLRNAIAAGRLAQSFVFAGARGVGKTTTARILARALNCVQGPTADPCGACDACVEIAQGRDLDVMEIDAATHTGIDNVREVIINNLAMSPVRDRHKIFIIDEVHRLSPQSFDALLKSIEEPPPHVVFIMATTDMGKIPDTILSRSQVYEFRTIATPAIVEQLRSIADAEGISADADALALIARHAEGSMRDAQSALDQVMAFAGTTVGVEEVSTVLGLVGRDLLFDILTAVADEDGAAAFTLAGRAVESGHDLRVLCRELASLVRALMVIDIDPERLDDPEVAFETDRPRLQALAGRYSREDLLRSFDLLARAEQEIREASQPRYALEMTLLKWIHLRKLAPIGELIAGLERGGGALTPPGRTGPATPAGPSRPAPAAFGRPPLGGRNPRLSNGPSFGARPAAPAVKSEDTRPPVAPPPSNAAPAGELPKDFKERFLAEVQRGRRTFFSLHIAQAQRIEVDGGRLVLTFGPVHETMRQQVEAQRPWLESVAEAIAGRKVPVTTAKGTAATPDAPRPTDAIKPAAPAPAGDLRARAMADGAVQAMLEVFPAEIRDVEELP